jgi:hypothetical protein
MLVKIINGVYGHYTEGKVVRKDKKSEPFDLEPDKAARLVSKGVAEYVYEVPVAVDEVEVPDLENMTVSQLRAIGKQMGITFKVGTTKAEMVEALSAEAVEPEEIAEATEPAPVFDPTEAVQ